jgi:hypothetical protein
MAKIGTVRKSKKEQSRDAELGLIIDEMGRAMWNADKEYIGNAEQEGRAPLTISMNAALINFQNFCRRYYGKKA